MFETVFGLFHSKILGNVFWFVKLVEKNKKRVTEFFFFKSAMLHKDITVGNLSQKICLQTYAIMITLTAMLLEEMK